MDKVSNSNHIFNSEKNETSKSSSIFSSSFWEIKENILSGFSTKLNVFQPSSNENKTVDQASNLINNANSIQSVFVRKKKTKDRSVFGQPSVPLSYTDLQKCKDISLDSLDTLDSGQSMGGSSCFSSNELACSELQDNLRSYRATDSIGIGSDTEPSFNSSSSSSSDNDDDNGENNNADEDDDNMDSSSGSQVDDSSENIKTFMKHFVDKIFNKSNSVTLNEKSIFGSYCQKKKGRFFFSRFINEQRVYWKQVSESTFYSLVQYFAIVLFECSEADDFIPAKTIMNMCFTFYYEHQTSGKIILKHYLYQYLKDQPIWKSTKFWRAVFYLSLNLDYQKQKFMKNSVDVKEKTKFTVNSTFGRLGAFAYYMKEFGLSQEFCSAFIQKQITIANLPKEQVLTLQQNINALYNQRKV